MKSKINKKTVYFVFFLIALSWLAQSDGAFAAYSYQTMEQIPVFGSPADFPGYLLALYKFGILAIGVSAMFMITLGGFMYISSAGNNANTGKAKTIITDAITGLVLALLSYVLLYTINPELTVFKSLEGTGVTQPGAAGVPGTSRGPSGTSTANEACPDPNSTTAIDFSAAANDPKIQPNPKCNAYDALFQRYGTGGVSACMLKAMAQIESTCGSNKRPSSAGACGLMQLKPSTAGASCQQLIADDDLSVRKAAEYIRSQMSSSCVRAAKEPVSAIFAGYNSGYGCTGRACTPKHALCPSTDCPGALCFECCINPGGLKESIKYAWNGIGLMKKCNL